MLHCQQPAEGTSKDWLILLISSALLWVSGKIKAQADSLAPQALSVGQEKDTEGDRAEG